VNTLDVALPDQMLPQHLLSIPVLGPVIYPTLIVPLIVWHPKAIATVEERLAQKQGYLGLLVTRALFVWSRS
jgi:ATP-dependent Lon protease